MINEDHVITEERYRGHHRYRLCWSAIFAGALVGVGLGFLLHLYGVAISLSAFSSSQQGASVIAIGGLLGMLIGVIAAMATAGFVAGYLGRYHYYQTHGGVIYGFITWSLILLISAMAVGPLTQYVSKYGESLSNTHQVNVSDDSAVNNAQKPVIKTVSGTNTKVAEITPEQLAWSGWIIFALFFIGGLSSCIGACCGMQCKRVESMP